MEEVRIITPPGMFGAHPDEDFIDTAMRVIGVGFGEDGDWNSKYGTTFENDVFMMHRYCWCDGEDCAWCSGDAPNFWFKPTDFKLKWYKYIGRDMEANKDSLPGDFMRQIFATHPTGMTLEQAIEKTEKQVEATTASFAEMFARLGVQTR